MDRELTAEWVGCYFGLQQALNVNVPHNEAGAVAINTIRTAIREKMARIEARLPPGTIGHWPVSIASPNGQD